MISVYLAGPSAKDERPRIVAAAAAIEMAAIDITERWWMRIDEDRQGRPTDEGASRLVLAGAWARNAAGIMRADAVIALARSTGGLSDGTREEISYAMGISHFAWERTILVGDPMWSLAGNACLRAESIEHAIARVREALR